MYREKHPFSLSLQNSITLDSIPSASGIAIVKDSAYIIGDDATCIYIISLQTHQFRKILLPGTPAIYRIPKDSKHDYESATIGTINADTYLLAFGSGTLPPYRDSLLIVNLSNENDFKKVSLTAFYERILQQTKLDKKDFNIEGATIAGNHLYLFNRGKGMIFQVNWTEFFQYINDPVSQSIPGLHTHTIQLPEQNGVQAGFSGACTLDRNSILFTASLENTKNWVADGEITGSYVGVLDVTAQGIWLNTGLLLQQGDSALKVKLESLDVVSVSKKNIIIESVADNDDGTSAFYRLSLNKQ